MPKNRQQEGERHPVLAAFLQRSLLPGNKDSLEMLHVAFNLILVYHGARFAFLHESSNFERSTMGSNASCGMVNDLARRLGLVVTADPLSVPEYPRLVVSKSALSKPLNNSDEVELGKILGFRCAGQDYGKQEIPRVSAILKEARTGVHIVVEVCDARQVDRHDIEDYYITKAAKYDPVLKMYDPSLHVIPVLEDITSVSERRMAVIQNNATYVEEHADAYREDLENFFTDRSMFYKSLSSQSTFLRDNWETFRSLYLAWTQTAPRASYLRRYRRNAEKMQERMVLYEKGLLDLNDRFRDVFVSDIR